jgi:hypothetical protein
MEILTLKDLAEIVLREFGVIQEDIKADLLNTLTEPVIFDALKKNGITPKELSRNRYTIA